MPNIAQQQTSPSLLSELSKKKAAIENSLPWDELGVEEKVERLREYTKRSFSDILMRQQKYINALEKRVQDLEGHKHSTDGKVIVEKVLGGNKYFAPSEEYQGTPLMREDSVGGGYI